MAQSYTGPILADSPIGRGFRLPVWKASIGKKNLLIAPPHLRALRRRGEGIFVRMWSFESPIRAVAQSGMIRSIKIAAWSVF